MKTLLFVLLVIVSISYSSLLTVPSFNAGTVGTAGTAGTEGTSKYGMAARAPYPTNTSTCTPEHIDAAAVLYPTQYACNSSIGTIQPWSLWIGITFGECTPNSLCDTTCEALYDCGNRGLTIEEYNYCASKYGVCPPVSNFFKASFHNSSHFYVESYSTNVCSGPPDSVSYSSLNFCGPMGETCGYQSLSWISDSKCPPLPEVGSAGTLSTMFDGWL